MPDFAVVPAPLAPPTRCVWCNTHADPKGFLDTGRELPAFGRIYLCLSGCASSAARAAGWFAPEVLQQSLDALAESERELVELRAELDREKDEKVISLSTLRRELASSGRGGKAV